MEIKYHYTVFDKSADIIIVMNAGNNTFFLWEGCMGHEIESVEQGQKELLSNYKEVTLNYIETINITEMNIKLENR